MELLRKRPKLSNVQMRVLLELDDAFPAPKGFGAREQSSCRVLVGHGYIALTPGTAVFTILPAGQSGAREVRVFQANRLDAANRSE